MARGYLKAALFILFLGQPAWADAAKTNDCQNLLVSLPETYFHLAMEQTFAHQRSPWLYRIGLALKDKNSGLCAATCVANIFRAAAEVQKVELPESSRSFLLSKVVELMEKRKIDARFGLDDRQIVLAINDLAKELRIRVKASIKDNQSGQLAPEDLTVADDTLKIMGLWVDDNELHAVVLLNYDPKESTAVVSDPNIPNAPQVGILKPHRPLKTVRLNFLGMKPKTKLEGVVESIIEVRFLGKDD